MRFLLLPRQDALSLANFLLVCFLFAREFARPRLPHASVLVLQLLFHVPTPLECKHHVVARNQLVAVCESEIPRKPDYPAQLAQFLFKRVTPTGIFSLSLPSPRPN